MKRRLSACITGELKVTIHQGLRTRINLTHRVWPVGDSKGWSPGVIGWPNYKPFKAGDVLQFSYNPQMHNVMVVDNLSYSMCKIPANAMVYSSGDDHIALSRGMTFFICGKPGHCESGMKIAVTAR